MLHTRTKQRTLDLCRLLLNNIFKEIIFLHLNAPYTVHRKIVIMSDVKITVRIHQ